MNSSFDAKGDSPFAQLTETQIALLKKPLPADAVKPHDTKSFLSTIKAIYVVERLNEVFGVGRWAIETIRVVENSFVTKDKSGKDHNWVVLECKFTAPEYGLELTAFGGNDNEDRGDAYKGAVTDALTKIGSYLYIGMDVFKGLKERPEGVTSREQFDAEKAKSEHMFEKSEEEQQKEQQVKALQDKVASLCKAVAEKTGVTAGDVLKAASAFETKDKDGEGRAVIKFMKPEEARTCQSVKWMNSIIERLEKSL